MRNDGERLVATLHVPCPNCKGPTFGPYVHQNYDTSLIFFEGFYCEDEGLTWYWNAANKIFEVR